MANTLRDKYTENAMKSDRETQPGMCRVETVNVEEMKI